MTERAFDAHPMVMPSPGAAEEGEESLDEPRTPSNSEAQYRFRQRQSNTGGIRMMRKPKSRIFVVALRVDLAKWESGEEQEKRKGRRERCVQRRSNEMGA
jgi:hypothetical protein